MLRPRFILLLMGVAFGLFGLQRLVAQPANSPDAAPSPLAIEPESNSELLESVSLMVNLGRFDLAGQYLSKITSQDLTDEQLLELRDQFGTVELYRLARIPELRPQAQQFLDRVSAASKRNASDPTRIDKILADLDKSARDRELAVLELKNIGILAVPRILQTLGDPQNDQQRDQLVYVLVQMGPQILPAMLGALGTDDVMLETAVLEVIGLIGDSTAVDSLWYPAFSEQQPPAIQASARVALSRILYGSAKMTKNVSAFGVKAKLRQIALAYLSGKKNIETDENGTAIVWRWDADQGTVVPIPATPTAAANDFALQFAQQAFLMSQPSSESQGLFLAAILADAGYRAGWDAPLPTGPGTAFNLALTSGVDVLTETINVSLQAGQVRAAESGITALSLVGGKSLTRSRVTNNSPLIQGLNAADRRVQFASAIGILRLGPAHSFRGSHRVVEILTHAINDDGSQSVLVIDPNIERGRGIANAVGQMGYAQDVVASGKEGFKNASMNGDVALILLHVNCVNWELSQTIANLRADARTKSIPLAIYGPTFLEDDARITIDRTPLSKYIVYSDQRSVVERQLGPFLDSVMSAPLTDQQRAQRAAAAMYWLGQIAEKHTPVFDLEPATDALFGSVLTPDLAPGAITVLTAIPTHQAQVYLAEIVLTTNNSAPIREQAALALAEHVRRHRLLLESDLLTSLKRLWENESDVGVQTALTTVVGAFEPTPQLVEERLERYQLPTTPAAN